MLIARGKEHGIEVKTIGGTTDHIHLLISLPQTMPVAKTVQILKGVSSKWLRETFRDPQFSWQEGYGAFSVSISSLEKTVHYIETQEQHHRKISFKEEFLAFLKKHGISWDERYIWK